MSLEDKNMLETELIVQCAPTLAGLKTANLFSCKFTSRELLEKELDEMNRLLGEKGVFIELLRVKEKLALIYVYRRSYLTRDLANTEIRGLLSGFGYSSFDTDCCIEHLKMRLAQADGFPHEIGVFLGYPLQDVIGFINHKGQDCKCCGMWKVYGNEYEANQLFEKLKKCSRVYAKVFSEGRALVQMCVAA